MFCSHIQLSKMRISTNISRTDLHPCKQGRKWANPWIYAIRSWRKCCLLLQFFQYLLMFTFFFFFPKIPRSVIYSIISDGLTFLLHFFPLKFLAIMKTQNYEMSTLFGLEEYICWSVWISKSHSDAGVFNMCWFVVQIQHWKCKSSMYADSCTAHENSFLLATIY